MSEITPGMLSNNSQTLFGSNLNTMSPAYVALKVADLRNKLENLLAVTTSGDERAKAIEKGSKMLEEFLQNLDKLSGLAAAESQSTIGVNFK